MTSTRYGIFLRPDPQTCWNVTQVAFALRQQFGLISAGAFPPHATLVGNLQTDASPEELIKRLSDVFENAPGIVVHNKGLERVGDSFVFNVHENGQEEPNKELVELAESVREAVLPISVPVSDFLVTPVAEGSFWGHLSVASHDLQMNPGLADEVCTFLETLVVTPPPTFRAVVYSLFEFNSEWDGHWWESLSWKHLKSWTI